MKESPCVGACFIPRFRTNAILYPFSFSEESFLLPLHAILPPPLLYLALTPNPRYSFPFRQPIVILTLNNVKFLKSISQNNSKVYMEVYAIQNTFRTIE